MSCHQGVLSHLRGAGDLTVIISADFVNNNPSAFNDAFWDIAGVHVYE